MIARILKACRYHYLAWRNPVKYARSIGVTVGNRCRFLGIRHGTFGSEPYLISIGNHVTITGDVRFITHDGGVWVFRDEFPDIELLAPIKVCDNVFIGVRSIIMPGVTIGENSIIGAGSVVTKNIPPNSVAVGCPARVIREIDDYRTRVLSKGTHTRSLSVLDKKEYFRKMFDL
jgi:acetyltransferase-like isoleucine patch superfamily enzyme